MFQKYIAYLRDNPEHYWFKRKIWGWGWVPVTWQGWAVIGLWLAVVVLFALTLDENSPPQEVAFTFILPVLLSTIVLIRICYKKGEKPKWMWGLPKDGPSSEEE